MNNNYIILSSSLGLAFKGKILDFMSQEDLNSITENHPELYIYAKKAFGDDGNLIIRDLIRSNVLRFIDFKNLVLNYFCKDNNFDGLLEVSCVVDFLRIKHSVTQLKKGDQNHHGN